MSASRTMSRAVTIAAVVALGAVFAGPAGSQTTTDEPPHGVAVPGLTSDKVSGEASGVRAVLRLNEAFITASAALSSSGAQHARVRQGPHRRGRVGRRRARRDLRVDLRVGGRLRPRGRAPAAGGGPVKDEEDKVLLDGPFGPITLATDLSVKTQGAIGDTGYAHSESTLHEANGRGLSADEVDVECGADLTGVRGSTEVKEGEHETATFGAAKIPNRPDPNEELADFTIDEPDTPTSVIHFSYELIANEQDKDDHSITVTGLHEKLLITSTDPTNPSAPPVELEFVETWFGRAHCDIDPVAAALVVEPKFTG